MKRFLILVFVLVCGCSAWAENIKGQLVKTNFPSDSIFYKVTCLKGGTGEIIQVYRYEKKQLCRIYAESLTSRFNSDFKACFDLINTGDSVIAKRKYTVDDTYQILNFSKDMSNFTEQTRSNWTGISELWYGEILNK